MQQNDTGQGLELESLLSQCSTPVQTVLAQCLEGQQLSWHNALTLCTVRDLELQALRKTADTLRREQAGETVTYVVNRNINFTNVCVKACKFCAFSRTRRSEQAYFLDVDEVVRRALEAHALGATEVCLQAGLAPELNGADYIALCQAVKRAAPGLHIHAFSPEEVKYGASRSGRTVRDFLWALKDVGLGSLPGTSAEILDEAVRNRISPGRITSTEWVEVIRAAHSLGLPTTATLMFGHVETAPQRMKHLDLLRSLQQETQGFTEFVPLSFVHQEAPLFAKRLVPELREGPSQEDVLRLYAIARLMLGQSFRNLQVSWVKQGLELIPPLLESGVNDLGGTLINESISTAAGAEHGQFVSPSVLRSIIRSAGRIPAQRDTRYNLLRVFPRETPPEGIQDELLPLDQVIDAESRFGSYASVSRDARFRYRPTTVSPRILGAVKA